MTPASAPDRDLAAFADRLGSLVPEVSELEPWDVDIDSLLVAELVLAVEEMGYDVDLDRLGEVGTIADLWEVCSFIGHEGQGATRAGAASDGPTAPMQGRFIRLRPLLPDDLGVLHLLSIDPRVSATWRFRSTTPGFQEFNEAITSAVFVNFVVCSTRSWEPLGLVSAINADHRAGHCEVMLLLDPALHGSGAAFEAASMMLDYLFERFTFRKVYADMLDPNARKLRVDHHPVVEVEGRRRAHDVIDGQFVDLVTVAVFREAWDEYRSRPGLGSRPGGDGLGALSYLPQPFGV